MERTGEAMKGCRPLTEEEVRRVAASFSGRYAVRDRALFVLSCKVGFRISEILSLRIGDVWRFGKVVGRVTVARGNRKGKPCGHTVALNQAARSALAAWIGEFATVGLLQPECYLFRSRKGGNRPIGRRQALRVLRAAFEACQLTGPLGCHSLRKGFALKVYKTSGHNLLAVKKLLGHSRIGTTVKYYEQMDFMW